MIWLTLFILLLIFDIIIFSVYDKYVSSAVLLILNVIGVYYFFDWPAQLVTAYGGPLALVYGTLIYLSVGIVIAAIKWIVFIFSISNNIKNEFDIFVKQNLRIPKDQVWIPFLKSCSIFTLTKRSDIHRSNKKPEALFEYARDSMPTITEQEIIDYITPLPKDYVDRIGSWVVQWPLVVIDLVIADMLIKIARRVSKLFSMLFTGLSKKIMQRGINFK